MAQSVDYLTLAQVMISRFVGSSPVSDSVLTAESLTLALDSVSPSLSVPPSTYALSLDLSKKKKKLKRNLQLLAQQCHWGKLGESLS